MWTAVAIGAGVFALLFVELKKSSGLKLKTLMPAVTSAGAVGSATLANTNATETGISEGVAGATTIAADAAEGNVGGAVSAGISDIMTQLTQHSARLTGAKNENQAADQAIPAYDADIKQVVASYQAGQITAAQAISALQSVDANIKAYLKSQVGAAGTAWDGSGNCNKSCTVGCCIYYNDLHSGIVGPDPAVQGGKIMDGATGLIPLIASGKAGTCWIPEVYPPSDKAYGNYTRAGYNITVTPPRALSLSAIISTI